MKKTTVVAAWMLSLMLALGGSALADHPQDGSSEDSDLSPPAEIRLPVQIPLDVAADTAEQTPLADQAGFEIQVLREIKGTPTPVLGLVFQVKSLSPDTPVEAATDDVGVARFSGCSAGTPIEAFSTLENAHFSVTNGRSPYRITVKATCGARTRVLFHEETAGGQATGIWQIADRARTRLKSSVGLGFWRSRLKFVWPGDADYYSWKEVHITRGDHWDVVGHELGHGIYDLADVGSFGGGEHKIDQCYSTAMALSEGWASYFSAWLSVSPSDPDARFEYMVPRRAPIRFETIPDDVCAGQQNEWRVIGFLWDLIDLVDDGEGATESFTRVWSALADSGSGSAEDAARALERAGISRQLIDVSWLLNFKTPR